jgi:nucleoside-diphosphate-sugar epimerase
MVTHKGDNRIMSEFWTSRRVAVTGAAGFIGSHLVERLLELGAEVTVAIRYNAGGSLGLLQQLPTLDRQRLRVLTGDLTRPDFAQEILEGQDTLFHLAAIIAIPYSYLRPVHTVENNVQATVHLLEAARRLGSLRRFVHTSSSEVYGTAQTDRITENHPLEAQSPYAASKLAADKMVQAWHLSYDFPVVTLRPFNTFGPRQSARAIIPTIITQALVRKQVFLGAQHPSRDFLYVGDTVEAFLRMGQTEGIEGRTYHVGSGKEISIGALADRIIGLINNGSRVVFDPTRIRPSSSEVTRLICDASRARADLGWSPQTTLDEGLQATVDFVSRNLGHYRADEYHV